MTDIQPTSAGKTPLGIGSIIGDTFRVFGRHFVTMSLIAFVPVFIAGVLQLPVQADPNDVSSLALVGMVFAVILSIVAGGITQALIIQIAYNDRVGRKGDVAVMVRRALSKLVYITVLSIAVGLVVGAGFVLLIVPGIWLFGALAVVVPAIVVEDANWNGMGRSYSLTKGYRWPIVLVVLLCYIPLVIGSLIAVFAVQAIFGDLSGIVLVAVESVIAAVFTPIFSLAIVLVYARLREIKEGISVEKIAEVFA